MKSEVIRETAIFFVFLTRRGIGVQNKRTGRGVVLARESLQFSSWVEAFKSAIDRQEVNALARGFLR